MRTEATRESWRRAFELAGHALRLGAAERERFVMGLAADDPAQAERVAQLLREDPEESQLPASESSAGSTIGAYRLLRCLGRGGMGVVYEAVHESSNRHAALKLLLPRTLDEGSIARFKREIELLGRLSHPNIALLYDGGTASDVGGQTLHFCAMELVQNARTIVKYAESHGLAFRDRILLFVDVCAAVEHAHSRGVIHRDLKPANLLVGDQGVVKVIDFGIARSLDAQPWTSGATAGGALLGTLEYMAPEQVAHTRGVIDERADVFALGLVLHELVTGQRARQTDGLSLIEAIDAARSRPRAVPSAARPSLPREIDWIVRKATEVTPGRRYASVGDLSADLNKLLAGQTLSRPSVLGVRRGLLGGAIAVTTILAYFLGRESAAAFDLHAVQPSHSLGKPALTRHWQATSKTSGFFDASSWDSGAPTPIDTASFRVATKSSVSLDGHLRLARLEVQAGELRLAGDGLLTLESRDESGFFVCVSIGGVPGAIATLELEGSSVRSDRVVLIGDVHQSTGKLRLLGAHTKFETFDSGVARDYWWFAVGGGPGGNGVVEVLGGAQLRTAAHASGIASAIIADSTFKNTGSVLVRGPGSRWDAAGIMCGFRGSGEILIEDAATLRCAGQLLVAGSYRFEGTGAECSGSVRVRGVGSRLEVPRAERHDAVLAVGCRGVGALAVESEAAAWTEAPVVVGDMSLSSGTLEVRHGASLRAPAMLLARSGDAMVRVTEGGHLETTGAVSCAELNGSRAQIEVIGAASLWSVVGAGAPLNLGGAGRAEMTIGDGGRLLSERTVSLGSGNGVGILRFNAGTAALDGVACERGGLLEVDSLSRVEVRRSLRFAAGSTFRVRVHPDRAPTVVAGDSLLGGNLLVAVDAGAVLESGSRVLIIECSNVKGEFSDVSIDAPGCPGAMVQIDGTGVWLACN